jgi:hypothetical protein
VAEARSRPFGLVIARACLVPKLLVLRIMRTISTQLDRRWLLAVMSTALVACYAPELRSAARCEPTSQCPLDQECVAGFCRLAGEVPPDSALDGSTDSSLGGAGSTDCRSSDTCATARMLGTVSGDIGHQVLTASGSRAAWFRVRVTEDDGTTGHPTRVAATLTRPASADFEVLLYVNPDSDITECSATLGTTTTSGNVKQTRAEWGEGTVPNGSDDSRDVAIEVRPLSGTCAPGEVWKLSIEGNWQ